MSGAEPIILHGVDVQRGRDSVTLGDGQQAKLSTVSVESWHTGLGEDCRVASESMGQLHEDNTYAIRWTYRLSATGGFVCVRRWLMGQYGIIIYLHSITQVQVFDLLFLSKYFLQFTIFASLTICLHPNFKLCSFISLYRVYHIILSP